MNTKFLKLIFILTLLGTYPSCVFSQSKINVFLDYHYQLGVSERGEYNLSRKDCNMYGNSLHLSAMYNFSKKFSAGLGIGADRYENPGYNTFPVFASVHYSPLNNLHSVYTYTNFGYAVTNKNDIYSGAMWDLGVGYKKMFRTHFGLNFQIGYNLKRFQSIDRTRHSIAFGIGVIF
jgi:hypothetical protein